MLKGIDGKRLGRDLFVNKQYVKGGVTEILSEVRSMDPGCQYDKVVIHTGTNDVLKKSESEICRATEKTTEIVSSNWPNCEIIISGIILHKTDYAKNIAINALNRRLRIAYESNERTTFLDNSNMTLFNDGVMDELVYYDNLHLDNSSGARLLAANLKFALGKRRTPARHLRRDQPHEHMLRPDDRTRKQPRNTQTDEWRPNPVWQQAPQHIYQNPIAQPSINYQVPTTYQAATPQTNNI